ncbi:tRNA 2-thiocytidine biosynthesis protein TtcA [Deinococcus sp. RL]|uniref:tRNA 2-thiocytidine(32) synthetase TtcA n=1 Tax=Deinococcus sp. RL TaxID=1489678 RepID=UPI0004D55539|nr:tRNA 2-thiocytidine(32) synthetase TtcA [Deinococcus sp. RL]KEF34841.1 tRNA 2-thiocytidine biosynthesis protein TtcA [Deinococcus sp. RL]
MTQTLPSPTPAPQTDLPRLFAPLVKGAAQAITDYRMIEEGDRVMVCLSGGKDSYTLLDILLDLQRRAPIDFEVVAVNLDQGQPGFPQHVLPEYLTRLGVPFHILTEDTYSVVKEKTPQGKTTCALCSRLRRGILYRHARDIGATKIALGHHREDILETLFMNLFFGARLKAMPPKLQSDDGTNVVIRPLAYLAERDIERYAVAKGFPIIPCNLCGSQENLQRKVVGEMLASWERDHPGRLQNVLRGLTRVTPSHLLDRDLFDFASLSVQPAEGDRGFDGEEYPQREFLAGLSELEMLG